MPLERLKSIYDAPNELGATAVDLLSRCWSSVDWMIQIKPRPGETLLDCIYRIWIPN